MKGLDGVRFNEGICVHSGRTQSAVCGAVTRPLLIIANDSAADGFLVDDLELRALDG